MSVPSPVAGSSVMSPAGAVPLGTYVLPPIGRLGCAVVSSARERPASPEHAPTIHVSAARLHFDSTAELLVGIIARYSAGAAPPPQPRPFARRFEAVFNGPRRARRRRA